MWRFVLARHGTREDSRRLEDVPPVLLCIHIAQVSALILKFIQFINILQGISFELVPHLILYSLCKKSASPHSISSSPIATMAFPYQHVLIIGATSGIGKAMANRLIKSGAKVTAVGRREDRVEEFVSRHGKSKAGAVPFDFGNTQQMPQFAAEQVEHRLV
jgi:NADPH:quinone reductase-like Zn-dependent oxidoreductase